MPEQFRVELYWSFRSPYSYLALPRVKRLAAEYPVQWDVRIVYPLAIRTPGYFRQMNPLARPYFFRDTQRVAEYLGVPFRRPALPFIDEVSRLLWDGSVTGWDQGEHLARAAERAGLDLGDMERAIAADPVPRKALIEANQAAQRAAGHWGVPLFVFEGEPFFGQDRLDVLLWRMKQKGLRPRA